MTRFTPFTAILGGRRFRVRGAQDEESGNFTLEHDDARVHVDEPQDLLKAAAPGEPATADFGSFAVTMWRGDDGRTCYRASHGDTAGPVDTDIELACWGLLARLGDANAPRACFFCRWSEIEPSTAWGNLGCAVAHAEEYASIATSPDARRRKWGAWKLLTLVDEWFACERFEVRPIGYGYRGRPA